MNPFISMMRLLQLQLISEQNNMVKRILLAIIHFYQTKISPMTPPRCRFYPSCSEYGKIAITRFGVFKGLRLTIIRILKCQPFHPGGYDPVPEKKMNHK